MELDGSEKRIQALFSELLLEDQSSVPQFGSLWFRAQLGSERKRDSLGRPIAVLISIMATVAMCSFAVWSWYRLTATPTLDTLNRPQQGMTIEEPLKSSPVKLVPVSQRDRIELSRQTNIARRRRAERKIAYQAALLSRWQSPTQLYIESPTDLALSSLPQLNQSVKDLESFLPKNNEIMKESNR